MTDRQRTIGRTDDRELRSMAFQRKPHALGAAAMIARLAAATALCFALGLMPAIAQVPPPAPVAPAAPAPAPDAVNVTGLVVDQNGALPVAAARLELQQGTRIVASTTTNDSGAFAFAAVPAGIYSIVVRATGYGVVRSEDIVSVGGTANVTLTIRRSESTGGLREIGRVASTSSRGAALQTTTTIQRNVDPDLLQRTNQIRVAEALGQLPGVNFSGQDSSVGDDIFVDIRGLKPSETQILLDGHPIGPLGVFPGNTGGGAGGFDLQDSPLFALANTEVVFGSGAVGLYGVDALGGSIDFQTLNPSKTPQGVLKMGIGDQGRQFTAVQSSGTAGRIGYVLMHAVQGTYGDFPSQVIPQTGSRGNDFTTATYLANAYPVTGNYVLRNDLLKLRYEFSPKISLTLTGYSATSWDDKSGNGDNDYISYPYALNQALTNSNCSSPTVPAGVTVQLDSGPSCASPIGYASGVSGPAGGGPNPSQAIRNQDYHARFLASLGPHNIVVDSFVDNYGLDRERPESNINGPLSISSLRYRTIGTLVSDDIVSSNNDVGAGFFSRRQYIDGDSVSGSSGFVPNSPLLDKVDSFFVRDSFTPRGKLSLFANAWIKHSTISAGTAFDPRVSLVYRPTPSDVIRLTGGRSSGDPAPIAVQITGAGGINPGNCNTFPLGRVPSNAERPEKASDLEMSVGHRFAGDTALQLNLYDTNETDTIYAAQLPASQFLNYITGAGPSYFPAVIARIQSICPNFAPPNAPPTIDNFFMDTSLNIAKARARGIELSGRLRVTPKLFFEGFFAVQSSVVFDVPDVTLQANPYIINGSQLAKIPLHKYGLSANMTNTHGFEGHLSYTHFDSNNDLNRAAYGVADASFTQRLTQRTALNLGFSNLFDAAVDNYGRIGLGVFIAQNRFGTGTSGLDEGTERFGLAPRSFTLSLTQRF